MRENIFRVAIIASHVKFETNSKDTALVAIHTNKIFYGYRLSDPYTLISKGPLRSNLTLTRTN